MGERASQVPGGVSDARLGGLCAARARGLLPGPATERHARGTASNEAGLEALRRYERKEMRPSKPSTSSSPPTLLKPPDLGIGLITYSRLGSLKECLRSIETHTRRPYRLVIADDGSRDGTVEWASRDGYRIITGARRGCAWNKNRALYYLLTQTDCDPILLLEDDTFPSEPGWESRWVEAADRWQHVNYCPAPPGSETPDEPLQCVGF